MSAAGSFCWIILPKRRATSRHKSFSIKPVGPTVPVSCPPWPASITMRPIFSPSARVRVELLPSRIGCGTDAGCTRSGFVVEVEPCAFAETGLVREPLELAGRGFEFVAPVAGRELLVEVTGDGGATAEVFARASFFGADTNADESGTIAAAAESSPSWAAEDASGGLSVRAAFAVCIGSDFDGPLLAYSSITNREGFFNIETA